MSFVVNTAHRGFTFFPLLPVLEHHHLLFGVECAAAFGFLSVKFGVFCYDSFLWILCIGQRQRAEEDAED
jgi:hypothetical protein